MSELRLWTFAIPKDEAQDEKVLQNGDGGIGIGGLDEKVFKEDTAPRNALRGYCTVHQYCGMICWKR